MKLVKEASAIQSRKTTWVIPTMRIPNLDGYRAASIVFVLCGHLLPLGPKQWLLNESVAALGMTMFFSLSGFLICSQLLADQHVGRFLVRRGARILPLAFAYSAIAFLIISFSPAQLVFTNLFLINYLHQYLGPLNGHLWSLCVEVHFYVAIAASVAIGRRRAIWMVWPACFAVTALRYWSGAPVSIVTHLRVDEILVGACLATTFSLWSNWRSVTWPVTLTLLAAVLLSCSPQFPTVQYFRPYLTAALFVSAVNQSSPWLCSLLTSRVAKYVAEISYALYVIHPATTIGWLSGTSTLNKYLVARPISFLLTFGLAHLSTFYFERKWQLWGKLVFVRRGMSQNQSSLVGTSNI